MDKNSGCLANRAEKPAEHAGTSSGACKEPLILAVETSGREGSVAMAQGEHLLGQTGFSAPMRHNRELLPAVCEMLKRFGRKAGQIEQVYISIGPGSFTGLRIAVTFAKTMHLANASRIVAVDTLDTIAANAADCLDREAPKPPRPCPCEKRPLRFRSERSGESVNQIAAVLDAKRRQFFIAVYRNENGRWEKSVPDSLMTSSQFVDRFAGKSEPIWLLGEGLVYYRDKFKAGGIEFLDRRFWTPTAEKVHLLGWQLAQKGRFADPLTLTPNYLRRPDVKSLSE